MTPEERNLSRTTCDMASDIQRVSISTYQLPSLLTLAKPLKAVSEKLMKTRELI